MSKETPIIKGPTPIADNPIFTPICSCNTLEVRKFREATYSYDPQYLIRYEKNNTTKETTNVSEYRKECGGCYDFMRFINRQWKSANLDRAFSTTQVTKLIDGVYSNVWINGRLTNSIKIDIFNDNDFDKYGSSTDLSKIYASTIYGYVGNPTYNQLIEQFLSKSTQIISNFETIKQDLTKLPEFFSNFIFDYKHYPSTDVNVWKQSMSNAREMFYNAKNNIGIEGIASFNDANFVDFNSKLMKNIKRPQGEIYDFWDFRVIALWCGYKISPELLKECKIRLGNINNNYNEGNGLINTRKLIAETNISVTDYNQDFIFVDEFNFAPFFTSNAVDKPFKIISSDGVLSYEMIPKYYKTFFGFDPSIKENINGIEPNPFIPFKNKPIIDSSLVWIKSNNAGLIFNYDGNYISTIIDGRKFFIFDNYKLTGFIEKATKYNLNIAKCKPVPSRFHAPCDRYGNFKILDYFKPFGDSYRFADPTAPDISAYWKQLCNEGIVPIADFTIPATIFTEAYNIRGVELCGLEEWNKNVISKLNEIKTNFNNSKLEVDKKRTEFYESIENIIKAHNNNVEKIKAEYNKEIQDLINNNVKDLNEEITKIEKAYNDKKISNEQFKAKLDALFAEKSANFDAKKKAYNEEKIKIANENQQKLNEMIAIIEKSGFEGGKTNDDEIHRKLDLILESLKPKTNRYLFIILFFIIIYYIALNKAREIKTLVNNVFANLFVTTF